VLCGWGFDSFGVVVNDVALDWRCSMVGVDGVLRCCLNCLVLIVLHWLYMVLLLLFCSLVLVCVVLYLT